MENIFCKNLVKKHISKFRRNSVIYIKQTINRSVITVNFRRIYLFRTNFTLTRFKSNTVNYTHNQQ